MPIWGWPTLLLTACLLTPVATVLSELLQGSTDSWQHLLDTVLFEYSLHSFLLMLGVMAGVLTLGVSTAFIISNFDFLGRRQFEWLLLLPLAMPAYIIAYTYTGMLDYSGPVQQFLRFCFGWGYNDYYFPDIRSLAGAIMMLSLVLYPYVFLMAKTAFAMQSENLFDAAKTMGLSTRQQLFKISLPLARPAIISATALAMMETLADYGTVQYFGVSTLSTGIYRTWFGMNDIAAASQLASILLIFVLILLSIERYGRQQAKFHQSTSSRPKIRHHLSTKRTIIVWLFCGSVFSLGFLIPFLQILYWAIFESLENFNRSYLSLLFNSLKLAAITASAAVIFALFLGYLQRQHNKAFIKHSVFSAGLGYAIPGTVIAVGVIVPFAWVDHFIHNFLKDYGIETGLILSASVFTLVFAYLVRFLAISLSNIQSGLMSIPTKFDEASQNLGVGILATVWRIHLPLLKPSLLSAALLVFVDTLKELPITLALRPFNMNTLAVKSYELANDEQLASAAPSVITIVLAGLIPVILLSLSMRQSNFENKT